MIKVSRVLLNGIEARRENIGRSKSMNISLLMDAIRPNKEGIDVAFTYVVKYTPNIGYLKLVGFVTIEGTKQELEVLTKEWKTNKSFGNETTKQITNMVIYSCAVNGIFAARTLNFEPPFAPPSVNIKEG